jgi:hypothetical protein
MIKGDRKVQLTPEEVQILRRPVNGEGGFQSLLRGLQKNLDRKTNQLTVTAGQFEKIIRYTSQYGSGGFEDRLAPVRRAFPRFFDKA